MSGREVVFEFEGNEYVAAAPALVTDMFWNVFRDGVTVVLVDPVAASFVPTDVEIVSQSVEELLYLTSTDQSYGVAA